MYPINFQEIDEEIVGLIKLLNYDCNLKTKYSCSGHKTLDQFYIMFHEEVSLSKFEIIAYDLAESIPPIDLKINFWIRNTSQKKESKVLGNWILHTNGFKDYVNRTRIINEVSNFFRERAY